MRGNNRVYSPLVTMWLLVVQRLHGSAPLGTAVLELLRGLPASFWPNPCKRVRDWQQEGKPLSSNTGGYNQARQGLPLSVVQTSLTALKAELGLDQLSCATPDMAEKEIEMAIAAYHLVRAVICLAAEQSGLAPRDYGFTKALRIVQFFGPKIAAAANELEAMRAFNQIMYYLQQAKLPRRPRSAPVIPEGCGTEAKSSRAATPDTPHGRQRLCGIRL